MKGLLCDLCGEPNKIIVGTSFTDCCCKECLQLVINECEDAIAQIEEEERAIEVDSLDKNF